MRRTDKVAIIYILIALSFIAIISTLIILSGSTFGQKCEKAFPDNGLEQIRCVQKLSNGERL